MDNITITEANFEDVPEITNVQTITWLATYPNEEFGITEEDIKTKFALNFTDDGKKKREQRIKEYYENPNYKTWVAKIQKEIVGFCMAKKEAENGRISAIFIVPNAQKKGLGKKLLETALRWLDKNKSVYVNVASYNKNAISFYKSFGFVKTDKIVQSQGAVLPSGKIIPEIEMVKTFI